MQELCEAVRGVMAAWKPEMDWDSAVASACGLRIGRYRSRRQAG
jgi:hypothetical protein